MKNNLIIPGILNIIVSFLWLMIGIASNMIILTIGIFVIVSGVICIMYSKLNETDLYEKRNTILTFAILLIPFNFISAVFLLVENDKIKVEYYKYLKQQGNQIPDKQPNNTEVTKEVKKLDTLLKLGILMVTISGIMIATTSWEVITDFVKMIIITLIGFVFWGLSIFSHKKLKIKGTTITYWLLSMIAFSLSIFMIGNYEILGEWFSIGGEGNDIFVATLMLIISSFSYITYKKFDLQSFLYGTFLGITISIALVVHFLSQEFELCLLIVTIIVTALNFLPNSESKEIKITKVFAMVASFVITALLILEQLNFENEVLVLTTLIIQIINLIKISTSEKNDSISILSAISIIGLITVTISNIDLDLDYIYEQIFNKTVFLISTILICATIIRNHKKNNVILAVVLPFIIMSLIFEIDLVIALYIGVISLIMIIVGFINKEYRAVYVEGIIFIIANIIIQLWELWGILPIWAYLLVGGLSLIGIVTYKELKK